MTADLDTREFLTFSNEARSLELSPRRGSASVFHEYGRLAIAEGELSSESAAGAPEPEPELTSGETDTERLGRSAFEMRNSAEGRARKLARQYQGLSWGAEAAGGPGPIHPSGDEVNMESQASPAPGGEAEAAQPLSARLTGRVAIGLVIVSGSQPNLAIRASEQALVVSEVQNGLSFLASQAPNRDVTFVHEISVQTVTVPEVTQGSTYEAFEAPWRDAALQKLGQPVGLAGTAKYARNLRTRLATNWAYVAFFTKYRLKHFAYAGIGGPRLVMHFDNDGWGSNQIDRVFAHETGHIFAAPDEYASSNCNCGGSWGVFGVPNSNCAVCAPGGGVNCIMRSNEWAMCPATKSHLGYNGVPQPGAAAVIG